MHELHSQIAAYTQEIDSFKPATDADIENYRLRFLGSNGIVKALMGELKDVAPENRKAYGQLVNDLKNKAQDQYNHHKQALESSKAPAAKADFSMPGSALPIGTLHPLRVIESQIITLFERIGFSLAEGPEIVDDQVNFGDLNIPPHHPARDMQDTFYVSPGTVLRTHTSTVQTQVMRTQAPPIRVICPGRVYRNETISARAHCFFHQCEGLYIDKNVSFADLKQTLYYFVTQMFGENTKVRFRPSYFPFTEPSAEMDISCTVCGGSGCRLCKHTGWVEILGCGMVHPNVLANFPLIKDSGCNGFAFGMGIERITQLCFQVNDLRLYSQNDVRFLRQFQSLPG